MSNYSIGSLPKWFWQVVILLALGVALLFTNFKAPTTAQVTFSGLGGADRTFQGEVATGMSVLNALNASAMAGGIPLQFDLDAQKNQTVVTRTDTHQTISADQMTVFINKHRADVTTVHDIPVRAGDRIVVKILSP